MEGGIASGSSNLVEVKIQRGTFLGDSLSPLLFVIALMPLSYILRKYPGNYKFSKSLEKMYHLMYMENIKLLAKDTPTQK